MSIKLDTSFLKYIYRKFILSSYNFNFIPVNINTINDLLILIKSNSVLVNYNDKVQYHIMYSTKDGIQTINYKYQVKSENIRHYTNLLPYSDKNFLNIIQKVIDIKNCNFYTVDNKFTFIDKNTLKQLEIEKKHNAINDICEYIKKDVYRLRDSYTNLLYDETNKEFLKYTEMLSKNNKDVFNYIKILMNDLNMIINNQNFDDNSIKKIVTKFMFHYSYIDIINFKDYFKLKYHIIKTLKISTSLKRYKTIYLLLEKDASLFQKYKKEVNECIPLKEKYFYLLQGTEFDLKILYINKNNYLL